MRQRQHIIHRPFIGHENSRFPWLRKSGAICARRSLRCRLRINPALFRHHHRKVPHFRGQLTKRLGNNLDRLLKRNRLGIPHSRWRSHQIPRVNGIEVENLAHGFQRFLSNRSSLIGTVHQSIERCAIDAALVTALIKVMQRSFLTALFGFFQPPTIDGIEYIGNSARLAFPGRLRPFPGGFSNAAIG